jgi:hypothetical protein
MAKAAEHGLRTTPGNFQMKGIVTGTQNPQRFFSEKIFESGSKMKLVSFGVKYDTDKTLYPTIQGFTRNDVYFSKKNKETNKTETQKVPWAQRMTYGEQHPGWNIIGVNVGITKGEDDKNVIQHLTEYDAAQYIKENLKDDVSVFVRGNLEFRSYTNRNNEVSRSQNLIATQVSLCANVDFSADGFEPTHEWTQEIVYTGIEQETDTNGKTTGRFILSGYVVSFNAIEPVSFIITNAKFAQNIRKKLKPYNSIQCHGKIEVTHMIEEVASTTTDEWGEENKMDRRANAPSIRELICTGANPETIDTESFSEELVAAGIKKLKVKEQVAKNFGDKNEVAKVADDTGDDWGDDSSSTDDEEESPW